MLERILNHIHNYFEKEIVKGTFTISLNSIELPFLNNGQYFRIVGSTMNDGVYQYPTNDLVDEVFEGEIWALAIPHALIELSNSISAWEAKNNSASPYTSESFGGYSYTKGTNKVTGNPLGWQDAFRDDLNHWRKLI